MQRLHANAKLRRRRKASWEIAYELDIPVSTVSKHLKSDETDIDGVSECREWSGGVLNHYGRRAA